MNKKNRSMGKTWQKEKPILLFSIAKFSQIMNTLSILIIIIIIYFYLSSLFKITFDAKYIFLLI